MALFKCKMCGGSVDFVSGDSIGQCDSCGTKQTLPKLDDERRLNLYDRANHYRRNNEYDKASGIYEQILNEDSTDAEAYWSLVLCRYGIEYVDDPIERRPVPTVNRTQFTSIFDDSNYKLALQYADGYQREIYEQEATAINEIQKSILEISQKEEPFDIFICYKETDENGRRTQDSALANDLYHNLTQEGFKVFFSRISLEDKLGSAYEPYIFAALNNSKVMVVIGTKAEYFNAVWVRNEWSRFLSLIKTGSKKALIPAYRGIDPYDLPEEFSHLQAQDMSKIGFMQDLVRGIKKIIGEDKKDSNIGDTATKENSPLERLLKNGLTYLKLKDYDAAFKCYTDASKNFPEEARGWWGLIVTTTKEFEEIYLDFKPDIQENIDRWYKNTLELETSSKDKDFYMSEFDEYMRVNDLEKEDRKELAIIEDAKTEIQKAKKELVRLESTLKTPLSSKPVRSYYCYVKQEDVHLESTEYYIKKIKNQKIMRAVFSIIALVVLYGGMAISLNYIKKSNLQYLGFLIFAAFFIISYVFAYMAWRKNEDLKEKFGKSIEADIEEIDFNEDKDRDEILNQNRIKALENKIRRKSEQIADAEKAIESRKEF